MPHLRILKGRRAALGTRKMTDDEGDDVVVATREERARLKPGGFAAAV